MGLLVSFANVGVTAATWSMSSIVDLLNLLLPIIQWLVANCGSVISSVSGYPQCVLDACARTAARAVATAPTRLLGLHMVQGLLLELRHLPVLLLEMRLLPVLLFRTLRLLRVLPMWRRHLQRLLRRLLRPGLPELLLRVRVLRQLLRRLRQVRRLLPQLRHLPRLPRRLRQLHRLLPPVRHLGRLPLLQELEPVLRGRAVVGLVPRLLRELRRGLVRELLRGVRLVRELL
uniref:MSP1 protein-like protein n=1 Tax=Ganoderma boninense TaxID=34458 RepID=A0A5K1JVG7_9APHY|nr:MSP1 protein-like protein [Ganoderma boninense]